MLLLVLLFLVNLAHSAFLDIFRCRGGFVPQANEHGGEYFEKFRLDYDKEDCTRRAGFIHGLIPTGKLLTLQEHDPFLRWWNECLEKGFQPVVGRVKPYYVRKFVYLYGVMCSIYSNLI